MDFPQTKKMTKSLSNKSVLLLLITSIITSHGSIHRFSCPNPISPLCAKKNRHSRDDPKKKSGILCNKDKGNKQSRVLSQKCHPSLMRAAPLHPILYSLGMNTITHIKNVSARIITIDTLPFLFRTFAAASTATLIINTANPRVAHAGAAVRSQLNNKQGTKMKRREVLQRAFTFWRRAGPIIIHYKFTQTWVSMRHFEKSRRDDIYEKIHDKNAQEALDIILDMRGLFIKIGQVLSSRPDFVPRQYLELFCTVQDSVPPWPSSEIKEVVKQSLKVTHGFDFENVFDSFESETLGSASIGQVHAATLTPEYAKMTGCAKVAIKVMHNDAQDRFRNDFSIFKWVCRLAMPGWKPILVELERQMMTEFNYNHEAANLRIAKENMSKSPYAKWVTVPEPFEFLCTKNVLFMEMLDGKKIAEAAEDKLTDILNGDRGMAKEVMDEKRRELFSGVASTGKKSSLKEVRSIIAKVGNKSKLAQLYMMLRLLSLGRNQKRNLDLLLNVHGYQIFVNGCFNGDPHPGNILELADKRLGLIDYGQFKHLNLHDRLSMAKIVHQLGKNDSHETVDVKAVAVAMREFGFRFQWNKDDVISKTAALFFDSDEEGRHSGCATPQMYLLHLNTQDPMLNVPDAAVFVARTSFLFRGMGSLLGQQVKTSKRWVGHAESALKTLQRT